MRNLLLFLLLLSLAGCGLQTGGKAQSSKNDISIGFVDSLYSKTLKEQRKFWVYIPNSFSYSRYTGQQGYPVAYLLDGEFLFHSFTGILQQLADDNKCPDMIVVGIISSDRNKDMTPTASEVLKNSGGGEVFSVFLKNELIPYIESRYKAQPYRLFAGHSIGGLSALCQMLYHTPSFNAFIAMDPSLWWDEGLLVRQGDSLLGKKDLSKKRLFISIANPLGGENSLEDLRDDTTAYTSGTRSIIGFMDLLDKKQTGLEWKGLYYSEEDHSSVPLMTIYDGLKFIFDGYRLDDYGAMLDSSTVPDSVIAIVDAHFSRVSQELGGRFPASERSMNNLGYLLMQAGYHKKAERVFAENIKRFPASYNVYDSMGDLYAGLGDKPSAKENYRKAMSLHANEETAAKLRAIE